MAYPFMSAGSVLNNQNPKTTYTNLVQETLNQQFYNSSDWYSITEETSLGSGEYQNVDVRMVGLLNPTVGDSIENDYKKLIFKSLNHPVNLGRMYFFESNYWITINVDKINTLAQTVVIKRCNNVLRWIGDDGGYYQVPCSLGYLITENRDYATAGSAVVVPSGMEQCIVQYNQFSNKIKANQRFLLGNPDNWSAWRVEGGGINNVNNQSTFDNTSVGFIRLTLNRDFEGGITGGDDLVNGIANGLENVYVLQINQTSISGDDTQSVQLQATVTLNGAVVTRSVVWESSDVAIATVSTGGLVAFVAEGNAVITCSMLNNDLVFDTCNVTVVVSPVDDYQVIISPSTNTILEGSERTWTAYLYENGIQQVGVVTFTLDANTVPADNYIYQVLGDNSFKITNYERFLTDTLDVTATSGIYSSMISISLRGAW
jgi:hypothetical protein